MSEPAPTTEPVLLTAPLTKECADAKLLTTNEALMSSLFVVPVLVNVAVFVLLDDPTCVAGPTSFKAWQTN